MVRAILICPSCHNRLPDGTKFPCTKRCPSRMCQISWKVTEAVPPATGFVYERIQPK